MADTKTAPTMEMGSESILSKITIKDIGCKPQKVTALPEGERVLPLCRIYGKATSVRYQPDPRAPETPFVYFTGLFEAINMESGEVFRSGKLYLPKGLTEMMITSVNTALEEDKNASIAFGFEIQSVKAQNPIGYSYQATPLRKPEAQDELAGLRNQIKALKSVHAVPKTLEGGPAKDSTGQVRKTA